MVVTIVPSHLHGISKKHIAPNALKVLNRLRKEGFDAYLVGGSVRDLLLKKEPKDFDVATNAHPEDVRRLFTNCRLIGRRFRLAHVFFGNEIIEVATFRAHHHTAKPHQDAKMRNGQIILDNVYGKIEEDAQRRDFSINALYYNIEDASIVDFSTGIADLETKTIRLMGNPKARYLEDPIRILRAIRFAAKTGFAIASATEKPLYTCGKLLKNVPHARLYEEITKLLTAKENLVAFQLLEHYGLLALLFPQTAANLSNLPPKEDKAYQKAVRPRKVIEKALRHTAQQTTAPADTSFLFAALLWPALQAALAACESKHDNRAKAIDATGEEVLAAQLSVFPIQKRITLIVQNIWRIQYQLEVSRHRAQQLLVRRQFRLALDFLTLRAKSGETYLKEIITWWTDYQAADEQERAALIETFRQDKKRRRKKRRTPPKQPPTTA